VNSPGATQLIRTFLFSFAADFDRAITAALLAQYAEELGMDICPKVLAAETCISHYLCQLDSLLISAEE
jgi:hypothetical protein